MVKDLRHAVRILLQAKGWTLVIVLSLALGIGANTAIFSGVNALLLMQIPARDPDTLVRLRWGGRNDMMNSSSDYGYSRPGADGQRQRATFSYAMYQQFRTDNRTMRDVLACAPFSMVRVVVDGQTEMASAFVSSGNYYTLLGVNARLGRTILTEDDRPSATPVAVISSKFWHSRFNTDPGVIGRAFRVNDVVVTIVGVLPAEFTGIQTPIAPARDISMALAIVPQLSTTGIDARLNDATFWWLQIMGRLKPGSTAAQVQGNLEGVFRQSARTGFESYMKSASDAIRSAASNQNRTEVPRLIVDSGARGFYDVNTTDTRTATILSVVVGLVLLIVCANVANLLLSRATARQKELSVRLSLGATRRRLIRQMLTESLLLSGIGGALGIGFGYWGKALLPAFVSQSAPLDWRVLGFVLIVTMLTGLLFGIAPAFRATQVNVSDTLKQSARTVVGSRSLLGKSLLVVQVAISLVLLVGAGLFLRTLSNLRHADVGFNPEKLLLFRISPDTRRYDQTRMIALHDDVLQRLAAVPGVDAAAFSAPGLLSGSVNSTRLYVRGRVYPPGRDQGDSNDINRLVVSPNFFEVMEIPVLRGRGLTPRDNATAPKVAVINEAAVKKFFPGADPIGQRFGSSVETSDQVEVVGVLKDAKYSSVREPAPPTMYMPYAQRSGGGVVMAVRTAGEPSAMTTAVRETIKQIDPHLPMTDVSTQLEQIARRFQQEKLFAEACSLFGALAMVVAAIGIFGLMSYSVSRRTNEIGIRMALGARREHVLRLVVGESMLLVVLGVAIGLAISLAVSQFVEALLFGLAANDSATMALAVGLMIAVSALAGFLPARRASRVDPMVALRYE
jgi:predicted permease